MKRRTKIAAILIVILIYGSSVVLLKGKLPNQDANIVTIEGSKTESLKPRQNMDTTNISLACGAWHARTLISGDNVSARNDDSENLIFSGNYNNPSKYLNKALPLFVANQTGLELDFAASPYLQVILASQPDSEISFQVGWNYPNDDARARLNATHPGVIAEFDDATKLAWINMSAFARIPHSGEDISVTTSYITIDVTERLSNLGLNNQSFVGLQISQYLIGFLPENKGFLTMTKIEFISLIKEPPYKAEPDLGGKSSALPDGSIVHIIRNNMIANDPNRWPCLQRAYVLYKMNASQDSLYTAFLVYKNNDLQLEYGRSGFVFTHTSLLNEVGTYIDWRRISIWLDSDFEPIETLNGNMSNGDYAIVFTPVESSEVHSVQITSVTMTFSELPYYPHVELIERAPLMPFLILTFAGIVPTILMFVLSYLYKSKTVSNSRRTIACLVLIGLGLRLILAPNSAHTDDTQIFSEIGALYFGSGVLGAQWVSLPGFVYLETAAYFPYALLRTIGFREAPPLLSLDVYPVELLFTKIPAILSDIGSFYFILKIADKCQRRNKALVAGLYLLNPLTVYISGTLGQFDSIFTFTLIAFTYYLVAEYNAIKASLFSGFSAALNPVGFATIIPFLSSVLFKKDWKTVAKGLLLIGGILGISIVPFLFESNSPVILTSYERLIGAVPGERFYGNSIDFYAYGTKVSSSIGYGLTFRFALELLKVELGWWYYPFTAGLILLAFVTAFVYKTQEACRKGIQRYVHIGTFMLGVVCLFQLTFPLIYEQFVVWTAGLMLVSFVLYQNRRILDIFIWTCISAGVFYVIHWGIYLPNTIIMELASCFGWTLIEAKNYADACLGVIYSVVITVTFAIICELWFREELSRLAQRIRSRLKKHERAQSV